MQMLGDLPYARGCSGSCFCTGRCRETVDMAEARMDFRELFERYGTRTRVRVNAGREVVE